MDKAALVDTELDEARQAVRALAHAGLPMTIGLAIRNNAGQHPWALLVASPDVEKHGPLQVIRFADDILKAGQSLFTIDDFFFIGPNDGRARQAIASLGGHLRHRLDDRPKPIAIRLDEEAAQSAFVVTYNPGAKASATPLVANKTTIGKAWAA